MKTWILIAATILLSGCASIHEGNLAQVKSGDKVAGLKISALETGRSGNNPFALFTVTFENEGDDWIRVESVDVDFDAQTAKTHSVVLGEDLVSWAEASAEKQRLDDYNDEWVKTGLFTAGVAAALVSSHNRNSGGTLAGLGLAAGVGAYGATKEIIRERERIITAKAIPEKHLYLPFSVPGKLFVRRWVLINKPSRTPITSLDLTVKTVEGKITHVNVPLKGSARGSASCDERTVGVKGC